MQQLGGQFRSFEDWISAHSTSLSIGPVDTHFDDVRIYEVIEDGTRHSPLSDGDLETWRGSGFDVLFDTTSNEILFGTTLTKSGKKRVAFGPHTRTSEHSTVLTILQIMAEHPGRRFTERTLGQYTRKTLERNTLAKYIGRLRVRLDDTVRPGLLLTDHSVAGGCSETGSAYYVNPNIKWRVIRVLPSVVSSGSP